MKWLELIKTVAPLILTFVPGMPPVLIPAIIKGIEIAEAIPGATGEQKKVAVINLVKTGMSTANAIHGEVILDPVALSNIVSKGIDTAVDTINIIHGAQGLDQVGTQLNSGK